MNKDQKNLEKKILHGIFNNNNKAWEQFIDAYGKFIYYTIRKTVSKKGIKTTEYDLEDIHQDFLLSLIEKDFKKLRSFRFEASLKTYLIVLANRFTLIWVNKTINKPQPKPLATEYEKVQNIIESVRDRGLAPDENLEEKEIKELIQKFIKGINQLNKDIFILHFIEEKTAKEIISLKGLPRATVYRKINNLREDLFNFYQSM